MTKQIPVEKFLGSPRSVIVSIMGKDYLVSAPNGEPNDFEKTLKEAIATAVKEAEARIVKNLIRKHGLSRSVREVLQVIQQPK